MLPDTQSFGVISQRHSTILYWFDALVPCDIYHEIKSKSNNNLTALDSKAPLWHSCYCFLHIWNLFGTSLVCHIWICLVSWNGFVLGFSYTAIHFFHGNLVIFLEPVRSLTPTKRPSPGPGWASRWAAPKVRARAAWRRVLRHRALDDANEHQCLDRLFGWVKICALVLGDFLLVFVSHGPNTTYYFWKLSGWHQTLRHTTCV